MCIDEDGGSTCRPGSPLGYIRGYIDDFTFRTEDDEAGAYHASRQLFGLDIGEDPSQRETLVWVMVLDYINIFLLMMYVYYFGNPILSSDIKEVFIAYPTSTDDKNWKTLDDRVK